MTSVRKTVQIAEKVLPGTPPSLQCGIETSRWHQGMAGSQDRAEQGIAAVHILAQ